MHLLPKAIHRSNTGRHSLVEETDATNETQIIKFFMMDTGSLTGVVLVVNDAEVVHHVPDVSAHAELHEPSAEQADR